MINKSLIPTVRGGNVQGDAPASVERQNQKLFLHTHRTRFQKKDTMRRLIFAWSIEKTQERLNMSSHRGRWDGGE